MRHTAGKHINFADVTAATAGAGSWWSSVGYLIGSVFALNLLLFEFNLLPVPPLDGSAALVLIMPDHMVKKYQDFIWSHPQVMWLGIFLAWQVFDKLFDPVFTTAISWLYPGVSYS